MPSFGARVSSLPFTSAKVPSFPFTGSLIFTGVRLSLAEASTSLRIFETKLCCSSFSVHDTTSGIFFVGVFSPEEAASIMASIRQSAITTLSCLASGSKTVSIAALLLVSSFVTGAFAIVVRSL